MRRHSLINRSLVLMFVVSSSIVTITSMWLITLQRTILVWPPGQSNPQRSLSVPLSRYSDVFVGMNGDIFFEHGSEVGRIEKWSPDRNESVFVANFEGHCYSLFIDTNNSLYCSLHDQHKVMKISLNEWSKNWVNQSSVAGNRVSRDPRQINWLSRGESSLIASSTCLSLIRVISEFNASVEERSMQQLWLVKEFLQI